MKVTFQEPYKSITEEDKEDLESVEFPSFTVITGKNGSGKTHFLEGINNGAIFIQDDETSKHNDDSGYGPTMLIDYNHVSLKNDNHKISYGAGSNLDFERIKDISIKINKSFSIPAQFSSDNSSIPFAIRVIEKMLEKEGKVISINEIEDIARYELELIDRNFSDKGYSSVIKSMCENLIGIYTENRDFLISIKKYFPQVSLETLLVSFSKKIETIEDILSYFYKEYLKRRNEIIEECLRKKRYPSEEEILDKCGESPLDFINRIFSICNYSFRSEFIEEDMIQFRNSSEFNPIIKLKRDNLNLEIHQLSSGEKVILSLSLFLLKMNQLNGLNHKVLLLDEIETNLHPSMLKNFLDIIKKSFVAKLNLRVFLVTHSPSTIALVPEESVFVMRGKDEEGKRLEKTTKEKALGALTEGFVTLERGLHLFDQIGRSSISIITEGKNTKYIERALSFYLPDSDTEIITGFEGSSGKDQLKTLFRFFTKIKHDKKALFVLDCDVNISSWPNEENNTYVFSFETNRENKKVLSGIENLFSEEKFNDSFYSAKQKNDGGQATTLNKQAFLNDMMENGTKEDFKNFQSLIDKIKELRD